MKEYLHKDISFTHEKFGKVFGKILGLSNDNVLVRLNANVKGSVSTWFIGQEKLFTIKSISDVKMGEEIPILSSDPKRIKRHFLRTKLQNREEIKNGATCNLREARERRGYTAIEAAKVTGISLPTWYNYESNIFGNVEGLQRVSKGLQVTITITNGQISFE